MTKKLLLKFFILLIPFYLFAQESQEVKKSIEESLDEQILVANEVIKKINEEKYINRNFDEKQYDNKINYFLNRININQRAGNFIAVKRDEIKLLSLQEQRAYENTLQEIIRGKKSFKDRNYFTNIIDDNIKLLKDNSLEKYSELYKTALKDENKVSQEFIDIYLDLKVQSSKQLFTLNYLKNNMGLFRKTNFFIDEFNLQYLVNQIDSIRGIDYISKLTSYHLKFSIGEIVVVLFIITFFRLLNVKIISILASFIAKLFINSKHEDSDAIRQYLRMSIDTPLIYSLYTLSIQISIFILIKDQNMIDQIMPWINTIYMALFTWALYAILNNSINIYAHSLLEKYPNVRKEMIVFILRIIKVILVLLVILFLFSQLGIDIKAIAASLGVGGIAIALASKDTLANFFGSLNIMTDNSFSQGDWIKTSEVEGTVVDIRMRTTRIRTFDNAMITIPNSQLANTHIMNWSKRKIGRRIKMSIGVTYESKMEDIVNFKNDIYEMLDTHPLIATSRNAQNNPNRKFEVVKKEDLHGIKRTLLVYVDEFDASSINILVYCFSRSPNWEDWLQVKEDVIVKISQLAEKNNCSFAYPTQTVWLEK